MSKKKNTVIIVIIVFMCLLGIFRFTEAGNYTRWYMSAFDKRKVESFEKNKEDYQLIVNTIIKKEIMGKYQKIIIIYF